MGVAQTMARPDGKLMVVRVVAGRLPDGL